MNEKCKYFDECSAPMCPMCEKLENLAWFADEQICRLRDVPDWVKRQKKIAKINVSADAGCFTLPMLERRCVIGKKITGITPEAVGEERKKAEKDWLSKHPLIKEMTEDEKEIYAARLPSFRGNSLGKLC